MLMLNRDTEGVMAERMIEAFQTDQICTVKQIDFAVRPEPVPTQPEIRDLHATHPKWVIRLAMEQATSIMDANQAYYHAQATHWLEKAALAHEVLGREDDWRA